MAARAEREPCYRRRRAPPEASHPRLAHYGSECCRCAAETARHRVLLHACAHDVEWLQARAADVRRSFALLYGALDASACSVKCPCRGPEQYGAPLTFRKQRAGAHGPVVQTTPESQ